MTIMTSAQIKRLNTGELMTLSSRVAKDIQARVDRLDDSLKALGLEGLNMQERGKRPVRVQFPGTARRYTYMAPIEARVGDVVKTPWNAYGGSEGFAEIVELGDGGFKGAVKDVLELHKPSHKKAGR